MVSHQLACTFGVEVAVPRCLQQGCKLAGVAAIADIVNRAQPAFAAAHERGAEACLAIALQPAAVTGVELGVGFQLSDGR